MRMKSFRFFAILFFSLVLAGCKSSLYSGLSERDANEIVMVLAEKGIASERRQDKDNSYTVTLENDTVGAAQALLATRGLPRQKFDSFGSIFQNSQMVASSFEERARFMYALNQELARSISQIPGVVDTRVHVMLPESSPLDVTKKRPRASVFVYYNPQVDLSGHTSTIKMQIVNAVEGLHYEDVSVALFASAQLTDVATQQSGSLSGSLFSLLCFIAAGGLLYMFLQSRLRVKRI